MYALCYRFAFMDGTVDTVCPHSSEETWVLNIKRGILSSLHNTMVSLEGESRRREVVCVVAPFTSTPSTFPNPHCPSLGCHSGERALIER